MTPRMLAPLPRRRHNILSIADTPINTKIRWFYRRIPAFIGGHQLRVCFISSPGSHKLLPVLATIARQRLSYQLNF